MKSRTKTLLTEDEIRMLAKADFGEDCEVSEITECKGGMFNAIYAMRREKEGDQIVLKVGVAPGTTLLTYEQDVMPVEIACYQMIREQTSIPVPEILSYDLSKTKIRSNYFFMMKLGGVGFDRVLQKLDPETVKRIRTEQAGYLAQLHQIHGPYYGYFTEDKARQYPTWKGAFLAMCAQILADAKGHGRKLPYERIARALEKHAHCLEDVKEPSLVDFDCHNGNIFVRETKDGYGIEGILDFERAFWGDPLAEFAGAFFMTDDIRKEPEFLAAYLKAAGRDAFTDEDAKKYQLYRMYLMIIMAAEVFRYGAVYAKLQETLAKKGIADCLKKLGVD